MFRQKAERWGTQSTEIMDNKAQMLDFHNHRQKHNSNTEHLLTPLLLHLVMFLVIRVHFSNKLNQTHICNSRLTLVSQSGPRDAQRNIHSYTHIFLSHIIRHNGVK